MKGWNGLGRMKHRIRRIDLGDLVRYRRTGDVSTVYGIWLDAGQLLVLLRLPLGEFWVPSQDCDAMEAS